jgi:hypothetical protein
MQASFFSPVRIFLVLALLCGVVSWSTAADEATKPAAVDAAPAEVAPAKIPAKDPPGMTRLGKDIDAWIDAKNKRVVVDGAVCLREGQLELFACIKGTKEHEAVVAVPVKAQVLHAALLAVGAVQGTPVKFQPKYEPATGGIVDVTVIWTDGKGAVHHDKAQDWIRSIKTGKAMEYNWVFAGSGFWQEEEGGPRHYQADGGDLICVSNFPSAMLDLPVESSQGDASLLFQAFTDRIPPKGTKVRLVLTPRLDKKDAKPAKDAGETKPAR